MKKFYAGVVLNEDDLLESKCNRIELEYYKISKKSKRKILKKSNLYGIEIVKKEYIGNQKKKEKNNIYNITRNEKTANKLLEILKENKVTPFGLEDTITELFKGNSYSM